MASPCSRFAARFPKARAASLETKADEDPSAFFRVYSEYEGGRVGDGRDKQTSDRERVDRSETPLP